MNFTPDEQRIFGLRPGDVLVTEGSGSLSSVGASAVWQGEINETVCFQNTLLRMRPRSEVMDGRFLGWWAQSSFGSGLFASLADGANIYHLSAERVRALHVRVPPLEEQRRIADFLDAETARIAQAAEALQQAIGPAAAELGPEHPRVLRLRQRRAAILVIGGDFRTALPEFDALVAAFGRAEGSNSDQAMACLRQAAHCRAELGQATAALRQFRQVLTHLRAAESDVSPTVLELRRNILMLLLTERDVDQAEAAALPLYEDLRMVYGPDHEETREIGDILARLQVSRP